MRTCQALLIISLLMVTSDCTTDDRSRDVTVHVPRPDFKHQFSAVNENKFHSSDKSSEARESNTKQTQRVSKILRRVLRSFADRETKRSSRARRSASYFNPAIRRRWVANSRRDIRPRRFPSNRLSHKRRTSVDDRMGRDANINLQYKEGLEPKLVANITLDGTGTEDPEEAMLMEKLLPSLMKQLVKELEISTFSPLLLGDTSKEFSKESVSHEDTGVIIPKEPVIEEDTGGIVEEEPLEQEDSGGMILENPSFDSLGRVIQEEPFPKNSVAISTKHINAKHQSKHQIVVPQVKPAYPCDKWEGSTFTCWFDRAIGDSITFTLAIDHGENEHTVVIEWKKRFHVRKSNKTVAEVIQPNSPPWNLVVGSGGLELRISPLTDSDFDYNSFSAIVAKKEISNFKHFAAELIFRINIIPNDLGFVYPGEELTINVESYAMLPPESMLFDWQLEMKGQTRELPSNMKVSHSGRSVSIKELRRDQEGLVTCAIYTGKWIFMTKRRFLIQEVHADVLTATAGRIQVRDDVSNDVIRGRPHIVSNLANDQHRKRFVRFYEPPNKKKTRFVEEDFELPDETEGFDAGTVPAVVDTVPQKNHLDNTLNQPQGGRTIFQKESSPQNPMSNGLISNSLNHAVANGMMTKMEHNPPQHPSPNEELEINRNLFYSASTAEHNPLKPTPRFDKESGEDVVLEIEMNVENEATRIDTKESQMIADCVNDRQCSVHATCIQDQANNPGYCKCKNGYRGNGIFCWEDALYLPPLSGQYIAPEENLPDQGDDTLSVASKEQQQELLYQSEREKRFGVQLEPTS